MTMAEDGRRMPTSTAALQVLREQMQARVAALEMVASIADSKVAVVSRVVWVAVCSCAHRHRVTTVRCVVQQGGFLSTPALQFLHTGCNGGLALTQLQRGVLHTLVQLSVHHTVANALDSRALRRIADAAAQPTPELRREGLGDVAMLLAPPRALTRGVRVQCIALRPWCM